LEQFSSYMFDIMCLLLYALTTKLKEQMILCIYQAITN